MSKWFKILSVALVAISFAFTGCQKKVTKVEPTPEPPPVYEEPAPPPPPTDAFVPEDMDAQLRELLQPIYFDFDKYDLRPDAISKLERIASFLRDHSSVRVLAEGHADERGSSEYNMGLGENRSRAIKNYLNSYGISSGQSETTSYGEERPSRSNCGSDDDCHSSNRRVEWQVLAK
jgi:peptidoglycan-associated lipoprotein